MPPNYIYNIYICLSDWNLVLCVAACYFIPDITQEIAFSKGKYARFDKCSSVKLASISLQQSAIILNEPVKIIQIDRRLNYGFI